MGRKFICGECRKQVSDFSELIQIQGSDLVFLDKDRYNDSKFICSECDEKLAENNKDVQNLLKTSEESRKSAEVFNRSFSRDQKGEFGERLVRFFLESTNWYVLPFGYEKTLNDLTGKIDYSKESDKSLEKVRSMPDFFCIHQKTHTKNIGYFIEVKYVHDNPDKFKIDKLKYYKEYWPGTLLIIVRRKFPYLLFEVVDKIPIKETYSVKDFRDTGNNFIYALSVTAISYLLYKFRLEHSSDSLISNALDTFEKTPENFFYSYNKPNYYAFSDERSRWTKVNK